MNLDDISQKRIMMLLSNVDQSNQRVPRDVFCVQQQRLCHWNAKIENSKTLIWTVSITVSGYQSLWQFSLNENVTFLISLPSVYAQKIPTIQSYNAPKNKPPNNTSRFSRPHYRSRLCYSVASVCRVCVSNYVLVHLAEKLAEEANRKWPMGNRMITWPGKVKVMTPVRLEQLETLFSNNWQLLDRLLWGIMVGYTSDS